MRAQDSDTYRDPLDLLRRFAPTSLRATVLLNGTIVGVETNDLSLFPSADTEPPSDLHEPRCRWKVVRDFDSREIPVEASIVMAGSLIIYSLGPACIIAADRERQEILAFIGAKIDVHVFQHRVYPVLARLTEFVTRPLESVSLVSAASVAVGDECNA